MPVLETEVRQEIGRLPVDLTGRDRVPPRWPGGGEDEGFGEGLPRPPFSNVRLGVLMLLAGEIMFFGGLVGAYLWLRVHAPVWPPPLQPRLPVGVTAVNTVVLLLSSYAMAHGVQAGRRLDPAGLVAWLRRAALLGGVFLAIQGFEWARLVRFGLTVSSGVYGGTFYTLIGMHGLHVVGALSWVGFVMWAAARGRYSYGDDEGLTACAIYWHFVVALWPILYVLVYLA